MLMVAVDDIPTVEPLLQRTAKLLSAAKLFTAAFLSALANRQLETPLPSQTSLFTEPEHHEPAEELRLLDYLDIPLLVSDDDDDDSESETQLKADTKCEVKKSVKVMLEKDKDSSVELTHQVEKLLVSKTQLSAAEFAEERSKIMKIVVKYVAMKITNSFPPELPRTMDMNEIPLERFLMILVSRLQLDLIHFMKGIVYLFRYMDIIYLLRYLNQLNNTVSYNEMGYGLKKLIVGCYKLALTRERIPKDWSGITGLSNGEINAICKSVVRRLNGKLSIKNVELLRLKLELFRFVKMVTKPSNV